MPGDKILRGFVFCGLLFVLGFLSHFVVADTPAIGSDVQTDSERTALDDFRQSHQQKLLAALSTPGDDDDEKVIHGMMLGVNRPWPTEGQGDRYLMPDQQARYYREAIVMARKREGGEMRAMELLFEFRQAHPLHRWFRDETPTLERYEQWYKQAGRDEKRGHSDGYIKLLVERSREAERASDIEQAQRVNREAMSIARATGSGWEEVLKLRDRSFQLLGREAKKIEQYQQRIQAGKATDLMLRSVALWQLLVLDDQPAAMQTAGQLADKALAGTIAEAGVPVNQMTAGKAKALAEQFVVLAGDPAARAGIVKTKSLTRAKLCYERFVEQYDKQDVQRAVVETTIQSLGEQIGEMGPVEFQPPASRWFSLMDQLLEKQHPQYNPGNHISGDLFEVNGNKVTLSDSRFKIPVHVDDDYELRFTTSMIRQGNDKGMYCYFPLDNEHGAVLALGTRGGNYFWGPPPIEALGDFSFPTRKAFTVVIGVRRISGDQVRLALHINGKVIQDRVWSRDDLKTSEYYESKFTGRHTAVVFFARAAFQISDIAFRPAPPLTDDPQ